MVLCHCMTCRATAIHPEREFISGNVSLLSMNLFAVTEIWLTTDNTTKPRVFSAASDLLRRFWAMSESHVCSSVLNTNISVLLYQGQGHLYYPRGGICSKYNNKQQSAHTNPHSNNLHRKHCLCIPQYPPLYFFPSLVGDFSSFSFRAGNACLFVSYFVSLSTGPCNQV